jgi:prephenate dehydratase
MSRTSIAISGIAGSFSEEAAQKFLHNAKIQAEIIYATTAVNTMDMVSSGKSKYGLVPLENSNGGIVLETVQASADYLYHIERIFEIDVQQNLIVLPGISHSEITTIVSHNQALAQCKFFLQRHWAKANHIEYPDTALAAQDLAGGKLDRHTAIIASKSAAELYGLLVLEPSIQDLKFNYTSFMAITKHD